MTTKAELINTLQADLDTAAGAMAEAIEIFKTAYITAHASDIAVLKLGGASLGQRLDHDKLATINTSAHDSYRGADVPLFDGQALQPDIYSAADTIIAGLQAAHPEAFA